MASNKTVNKTEGKVVEKNDLEKVQEVAAAVRHKAEPVVAPGEHYKKVKVHLEKSLLSLQESLKTTAL